MIVVDDDVRQDRPLPLVERPPVVVRPDHPLGGHPGKLLAGLVPEHDLVVRVEREGGDRRVLDKVLGKLLLAFQHRLQPLALR